MILQIKIPRNLYEETRLGLLKPHAFAYERIGFLKCKIANVKDNLLIMPYKFLEVDDGDYIRDRGVGAKISSHAIRKILQETLDSKDSILHVHIHSFPGKPSLSFTDKESLKTLVPSFQNVLPNKPHGFLLLSDDDVSARVILPNGKKFTVVDKISIVGFPLVNFYER